MRLYIVRHAEPNYELNCLTELGRKQSLSVCKRLENVVFKKAFLSPEGRAIQTGRPLINKQNLETEIIDEFAETYSIKYWYTSSKKYPRCFLYADFESGKKILGKDECFSNIENEFNQGYYTDDDIAKLGYEQHAKVVDNLLESIGYKKIYGKGNTYEAINPNSDNYIIFSHGINASYLISHILNIAPHIFIGSFVMRHTAVSIIEFANKEGEVFPRALSLCDLGHLACDNIIFKG